MAFRREFKVGIFMLAGLCTMGATIFLIGEERRAFSKKESYFSVFKDVQGLRRGSPVRMGGVDIGAVSEVAYGADAKDPEIYVHMSVVATEGRRIRGDSVATIEAKGLLGDKMIVVTVGSPMQAPLAPGAKVKSKEAEDMSVMIAKLGAVASQAEVVMGNLERTTASLADEKLHGDLKTGVHSLSRILQSVENKEGYVGRLFSDQGEADRVSRTLANLERVTGELETAGRGINQILARVQQGPGLAHEVLYGEDSSKAVAQLGRAADELGATLKGIREGNGLMRGVLYGGGQSEQLVADLNGMSGDLRKIVADLRAGRGTLGALLVDPSVYEDLKLVLGNVERNKALRALVRYSIKQDDTTPRVHDPDSRVTNGAAAAPSGPTLEGAARASGE